MKTYIVEVQTSEIYDWEVEIEANTPEEAEKIVAAMSVQTIQECAVGDLGGNDEVTVTDVEEDVE